MTEGEKPYISIVAVGRNDNYGGNFVSRLNFFTANAIELAESARLPLELILIDWNPPEKAAPLSEALRVPAIKRRFTSLRVIQVSPSLHQAFENADRIPLFEYIGKNAGVVRARGEFILTTNPDILFSEGLMQWLAKRQLEKNAYYRTARYDISEPVPDNLSTREALAFCKSRIEAVHGHIGSTPWSGRYDILRFCKNLKEYLGHSRRQGVLFSPFTNAAGDFILMHCDHWKRLGGFPELPTHSFIDSYLVCMAHFSGIQLRAIKGKGIFLFHQYQERASGISRPFTDLDLFYSRCRRMIADGKALELNGKDWGLGEAALPERVFS